TAVLCTQKKQVQTKQFGQTTWFWHCSKRLLREPGSLLSKEVEVVQQQSDCSREKKSSLWDIVGFWKIVVQL
ncbi:hypothetical protein ACQP3C_30540, partial [Escherichia coli]